jgi:hypothetical protein
MNWYNKINKISMHEFEERNVLNKRIRLFKNIVLQLRYMVKYVYQNPGDVQKNLQTLADSKEMSSFPSIKSLLLMAAQKALDNYKQTAILCDSIAEKLYQETSKMLTRRKELSKKVNDRIEQARKG